MSQTEAHLTFFYRSYNAAKKVYTWTHNTVQVQVAKKISLKKNTQKQLVRLRKWQILSPVTAWATVPTFLSTQRHILTRNNECYKEIGWLLKFPVSVQTRGHALRNIPKISTAHILCNSADNAVLLNERHQTFLFFFRKCSKSESRFSEET
uniref:Uncharacterized protein n=1 Tax=Rhipicephalus zambeziensis TaxID=60191 RepID=A0A224YI94_9ACAR